MVRQALYFYMTEHGPTAADVVWHARCYEHRVASLSLDRRSVTKEHYFSGTDCNDGTADCDVCWEEQLQEETEQGDRDWVERLDI